MLVAIIHVYRMDMVPKAPDGRLWVKVTSEALRSHLQYNAMTLGGNNLCGNVSPRVQSWSPQH